MRYWIVSIVLALLLTGCNQSQSDPAGSPTPEASPSTQSSASATPEATETPGATAARVFFVNLEDGAKVKSPVEVKMGVEGMEVVPAGQDKPNSGHHHIIIDGEPIPMKKGVPADEKHIHFGKGQTEASVELSPGEHTLTLQFADYAHLSYGPEMSATVKITVEE